MLSTSHTLSGPETPVTTKLVSIWATYSQVAVTTFGCQAGVQMLHEFLTAAADVLDAVALGQGMKCRTCRAVPENMHISFERVYLHSV